jgi:hypothetical protein
MVRRLLHGGLECLHRPRAARELYRDEIERRDPSSMASKCRGGAACRAYSRRATAMIAIPPYFLLLLGFRWALHYYVAAHAP